MDDIYVDADYFAIIIELKWCKESIGLYDIVVSFDTAGKKEGTNTNDDNCDYYCCISY